MSSELRLNETERGVEAPYHLKKVERSSAELTNLLHTRLEQKSISERYRQQFGVYVNKNAIEHIPNFAELTITELLKLAKQLGLLVAFYGGGIGIGIGIGINNTDSTMPVGIGKAQVTMQRGQSESSLATRFLAEKDKNVPIEHAAEFLSKNFDIVIVLEPTEELDAQGNKVKKRTMLSSLAADAASRTLAMEQLREQQLVPEIYNWSDSGFKETQICIAAYKAIELSVRLAKFLHIIESYDDINAKNIDDILLQVERVRFKPLPEDLKKEYRHEETMPVFGSGLEAYRYLKLHENVDIIIAASPEGRKTLAFAGPLFKSDTNPILQRVKAGLFAVINEGVGVLGKIDKSPLVDAMYSDTPTIPEELRGPIEYISQLFGIDKNPALSKILTILMTGQYLPSNFSLLISRLAEIGRAEDFSVGNDAESLLLQQVMERIMPDIRGEGMIAFLNDRGMMKTVDSTRSKVAQYLNTIFPQKVIHITSNPEVAHKDVEGKIVHEKTSHASIKEPGAVDYIRAYIAMAKLDLFPHLRKDYIPQAFQKLKVVSRFTLTSPEPNGDVDPTGSMMHDAMPVDIQRLRELVYLEHDPKKADLVIRALKPFDHQLTKFIEQHKLTNIDKLLVRIPEPVMKMLLEKFKFAAQSLATYLVVRFIFQYIDEAIESTTRRPDAQPPEPFMLRV